MTQTKILIKEGMMMQRTARRILVKVPGWRCSNCATVMPTPKPPLRCVKCGAAFHHHLKSKIGLALDGKE